jgi:hypothetical protein
MMRRFISGVAAIAVIGTSAGVSPVHGQDAASLKARHAALHEQLASNPFRRPLYLESRENPDNLRGDIYGLIEQPYAVVGPALRGMRRWCDILILHLNVKSCRFSTPKAGDVLHLGIGRKLDWPAASVYPIEFSYKEITVTPDYLRVALNAQEGPFGTSNYRIVLEVVALDVKRSFLHLSYSYAYGRVARIAMQGYLATIGRNKPGFSVTGRQANGQPIYIRGMRGVIERNAMRYFLAIEAYLGALSTPAPEQFEKRLNDWFTGIERYPLQLHELERDEYLDMKRKQYPRRRAPDPTAAARQAHPESAKPAGTACRVGNHIPRIC